MIIEEGKFYFIKDSALSLDSHLWQNYNSADRPHFLPLKDNKTSLLWMVPCTTGGENGIKRYEDIIAGRLAQGRKADHLYITKIHGRPTVLLLQDMFPVCEKFIKNEYIRGGRFVEIADPNELAAIKKSARRIVALIRDDVKFTNRQPDAKRIESIMLDEIESEKNMQNKKITPFKLNQKISGLTPYDPISGEYPIRLDANESFLDLPEETRADILKRIANLPLNRYPDHKAGEIRRLFADYIGISPGQVMAGNGSDELLSLITQAFLMKGDAMLTVDGDFSMYRFYASLAEGKIITVSRDEDYKFSTDEIIKSIRENNVKLFIFSNPCNPTSTGISAQEVIKIVDSCPDCMIVCDEAYMDFWDQSVIEEYMTPHTHENSQFTIHNSQLSSGIMNHEYSNLIVLKTCSKAFRMAGIRCGFVLSCPQITQTLMAVKSPYNLSSLTQSAAAAVLSRPDGLREAINKVKLARDELIAGLRNIQSKYPGRISFPDSRTNFAWIGINSQLSAEGVFEDLKSRGIIVRCMQNHLRVTAGNPDENKAFLEAFEEIIDKMKSNIV